MPRPSAPGDAPGDAPDGMTRLDPMLPVWDRVFTVAPLVIVGTREGDGYNLAPKHMATPLGWGRYYGFVCTPTHGTYRNVQAHDAFTVSFPAPHQVVETGLSATPRKDDHGPRPGLDALPIEPAEEVDGRVLKGARLVLECELDRVIDGFDGQSLVIGRIVAARAHPDALRTSEVDDDRIVRRAPLLAYLSPGRFAEISDSRTFPFPAEFTR